MQDQNLVSNTNKRKNLFAHNGQRAVCRLANPDNSLLYACVASWFACCVLKESTIDYLFDTALDVLQIICIVGMLINELRNSYVYRKFDLVFLGVIAFIAVAALVSRSLTLLQACMIIYLARNSDYKTIFKISCITLSITLFIVCAFSYLDVIDAGPVLEDGYRHRESMGFQWPSRVGNYLLAILLSYLLWKQDEASLSILIVLFAISGIVYCITAARNPFLFSTGLVGIALYARLSSKSITTGKLCKIFFVAIALFVIGYCYLSFFYNPASPVEYALNKTLSNRLLFARNAFFYNGVTLLGCETLASTVTDPYVQGYLDSSYLRIIGYYGLLVACIVFSVLVIFTKRIIETKNIYFIICLACVLIHSILEGQLYALQFSPILFLLPSMLSGEDARPC